MRLELKRVDVAVRRGGLRRGFGVLMFLLAVAGYASTFAGAVVAVEVAGLATLCLLLGVGLLASASTDLVDDRGGPGAVLVDGEGLEVHADGGVRHRWPLTRVQGGWKQGMGHAGPIVLRLRGGTSVTVWTRDRENADALLVAATGARAARFPLDPTGLAAAKGWFTAGILLLTPVLSVIVVTLLHAHELAEAVGAMGALLSVATLGLTFLQRVLPLPSVVVGSEGLGWGHFGRHRLGYGELVRVERYDTTVLLTTRGGVVVLDTVGKEVAVALHERIEAARAAFDGAPPSLDLARLERGGRTRDDWQHDLARVLDEPGYRAAALGPDLLLRIAEDARAEPERRVAASVALSARVRARPQLRVAAERCAHPALRVALTRAAEGELDLEAIEAARRAYEPKRRISPARR